MDYEVLWKNHIKWVENGIVYYKNLLEHTGQKNSEQYDNVANILATYEFHLDRLRKSEGT